MNEGNTGVEKEYVGTGGLLLGAGDKIIELRKLLLETVLRCQLFLPEDEEQLKWFEDSTSIFKSDIIERLGDELGLGKLNDDDES